MEKSLTNTNMRVLRRTKPKLRPGDVFAYLMPDNLFRFGRVIRTDAIIGGFPNCILLYFYRAVSERKEEIPRLESNDLLIAPRGTNKLPWTRGYFETIAFQPLGSNDVLGSHCFWDPAFKCYRDADNNVLPNKIEPCGFYGLDSYRTIDDALSKALGFPLAPD